MLHLLPIGFAPSALPRFSAVSYVVLPLTPQLLNAANLDATKPGLQASKQASKLPMRQELLTTISTVPEASYPW